MSVNYELLMSVAEEGAPALEEGFSAGPSASLLGGQSEPKSDKKMPSHLWDEGAQPNDLQAQRWGLIVPEGDRGDRLLELVAPLVKLRESEQGGKPLVFRAPSKLSAIEAAQWKKEKFRGAGIAEDDLPRYQLLLGDFHELSLETQLAQSTDGFVGRLAFDDDDGYRKYVDKVLKWESRGAVVREANTLLHTVHDNTGATRLGHQVLVEPGEAFMRKRRELGKFPTADIKTSGDEFEPELSDLLDAARGQHPTMLFSLSHGDGPPRRGWASEQDRRLRQGAMSFGSSGSLAGSAMVDKDFLPGGIWFMLACYGAGTPSSSAYRHWLAELAQLDQFSGRVNAVLGGIPKDDAPPFVAALPKAVLAAEHGPLAFMGHVDLAWSYSFQELDGGPRSRPQKFTGVLRSALYGDRIGIAFRQLYKFRSETDAELTAHYDAEAAGAEAERVRRGHLWMLRNDLGAYVLLGDPAAHLPIQGRWSGAQAKVASAPSSGSVSMSSALGVPTARSSEPAAGQELPLGLEELEEAIAKVILGEESTKTIAREYDIARGELQDLADAYQEAGRRALKGS